ncbi:MAG: cytochrome b/b6 domain-containing protein [Rhodospirillaceae bacterium]|nr:cytochrome b/b6 domain-containing protein [Rhodospirillaceae bacterium]MBT4940044.1 cytochrome b/b6 domain-containing protein [Rhodospirillaceae bacterium]MBT5938771.1 cytochrome b/b6 domain-containing protein [Rhodospirillaceae bacterium]MBT7265768.1 cytochrome b/b6 domain-containing protein [Rhodospirillaceae bacterium]
MTSSNSVEDKIIRHKGLDRAYHWTMALSAIVLMGTSFLPILGLKFPWVTVHWIAGVVLTIIVIIHIIRALFWQDRTAMGIGLTDIKRAIQSIKWVLRSRKLPPDLPGKYPLLQKLYHHAIAGLILALIGTGGVMLAKIDTPFWQRNPYMLSAETWGWVYVVHDLAAMAVVTMVLIHIYFGIRPEKLWITRSMLLGWISRSEYAKHHDPDLWAPEDDQV